MRMTSQTICQSLTHVPNYPVYETLHRFVPFASAHRVIQRGNFFFFFSYRLVIEFISLRTAPSWSLFIRAVSLESYHFLNISFTRSLETDYSKLVVGLLPSLSLSPSLFTLPSPSILALFSPPSFLPSYFSPSFSLYLSISLLYSFPFFLCPRLTPTIPPITTPCINMIVAQFANYQRTISTDTLSANQEFTNSSRLIPHDNRLGNLLDLFAEALCRRFLICRLVMLSWHSSTLRYDDALCASLFPSLCLSLAFCLLLPLPFLENIPSPIRGYTDFRRAICDDNYARQTAVEG